MRFLSLFILVLISISPLEMEGQRRANKKEQKKLDKINTLFYKGQKEKNIGNTDAAITTFNDLLKLDKEFDLAHFELSKLYARKGDYISATHSAKKAYALDKENIWYLIQFTDLLFEQREYDLTIPLLIKLREMAPSEMEYGLKLGYAYNKESEFKKALTVYDEIEKTVGVDQQISRYKIQIFSKLKKPQRIENEYLKLIKNFPSDDELYMKLADFYIEEGRDSEAITLYETLWNKNPNSAEAGIILATFQKEKGNTHLYKTFIDSTFLNFNASSDVKIRYLLSTYDRVTEEDLAENLRLSKLLVETHPTASKGHIIRGDFLNKSGDKNEAFKSYNKSVQIDPSEFQVWEQMLFIQSDLQNWDSIIILSNRVVEFFPNKPLPYYFIGVSHLQKENYAEGISALEKTILLAQNNKLFLAQVYAQLGQAYHDQDKFVESDTAFERALVLNPEDAFTLNNYSYFLSLRKVNLERAKEMSKRSIELDKNNASFLDTYGWILFQMDNFTEAKIWLEKSIAAGGDKSPEVLEHLGDVYFKLGQKEKAMELWRKAGEKSPNNTTLNKKIITGKLD